MTITTTAKGLVTVFGGSGFVGRHVVRALLKRGWRVRAAVRRPDLAGHLQPLGMVGWVQPIQANLRIPLVGRPRRHRCRRRRQSRGDPQRARTSALRRGERLRCTCGCRGCTCSRRGASHPYFGDRCGCRGAVGAHALQGRGRGRGLRDAARCGRLPALAHVRAGGSRLQPLRLARADHAGGAADRRRDPLPAGLRRRRRARRSSTRSRARSRAARPTSLAGAR